MAMAVSVNGVQNEQAYWLAPVAEVNDPKGFRRARTLVSGNPMGEVLNETLGAEGLAKARSDLAIRKQREAAAAVEKDKPVTDGGPTAHA